MRWNSHKKPVRVHKRQADFAVSRARENPYKPEEPKNYRGLLFGILGAGSALGSVALALFHPAFQIDLLSISGTTRTDYAEVQKTARQVLDSKIWWFIPGQNYFLVDQEAIEEVVKARFSLESVSTTKEFPHTLKITLTERAPELVIVQDNTLIALDQDANEVLKLGRVQVSDFSVQNIMSEARLIQKSASVQFQTLPVLILPNAVVSSTTMVSTTTATSPELIAGVLNWNTFLRDVQVAPNYFLVTTLGSKIAEGEIGLSTGSKLLVNFTTARDSQFLAARTFWDQNKSTSTIQYLDLRYPGKVFWK